MEVMSLRPRSVLAKYKLAAVTVVCTTALFAQAAAADRPYGRTLDEIVVFGRALPQVGSALSASEGLVGYDDIRLAPLLRVGELVEAVPGMVATQHSGTGKANQYFLRGFNLDHGTDFSASAEGVPLNMRTHGHGHGYLDINFLIPELVATTNWRKGPYYAGVGDFSSAGSVEFGFYDRLDRSFLSATVGGFDYYRGLAAGSVEAGPGVLTGALDLTRYDGPWDLPEDLGQTKFHVSYVTDIAGAEGKFTLQGYDGSWNATDQIPRRAVKSGLIDDLGHLDPDLGGDTSRYALTGRLDFGAWNVSAYLIDYELSLLSNFTYFLDDPLRGDEFEQTDDRTIAGLALGGAVDRELASRPVTLRWGTDLRYDDIHEVGLFHTAARAVTSAVRRDAVEETSLGAFGEAEIDVSNRLRATVGLRADYYSWDVDALQDENSGSGNDSLLSPKLSLAWRFNDSVEGYANWGLGFHSNDVRGTTIAVDPQTGGPAERVDALVRSNGRELGLRMERGQRFNATLTAFWLDLDSELVFVGDAGTTEPNDATQRFGVELVAFWQANDWLAIHANYTAVDASFKADQGGGREIPGAVDSTFALGLNGAWDNGLRTSLRLRYLGEAPLIEDNSVKAASSLLVNAGIAWRLPAAELRLDVFNLLDSDDDDISYYYASRLPGEPAAGVDDVHFHPLEPRTIRGTVTFFWE